MNEEKELLRMLNMVTLLKDMPKEKQDNEGTKLDHVQQQLDQKLKNQEDEYKKRLTRYKEEDE